MKVSVAIATRQKWFLIFLVSWCTAETGCLEAAQDLLQGIAVRGIVLRVKTKLYKVKFKWIDWVKCTFSTFCMHPLMHIHHTGFRKKFYTWKFRVKITICIVSYSSSSSCNGICPCPVVVAGCRSWCRGKRGRVWCLRHHSLHKIYEAYKTLSALTR